jgi:hypothetical protein
VALRSLLDRSVPPLAEVELRLASLRRRVRQMLAASAVLGALAGAAVAVDPRAAIALGVATVTALVFAAWAELSSRSVIWRLLWVRDAYRLEVIREAGFAFATLARRRRLAAGLRRLVAFGDGEFALPGYAASLDERVYQRRGRLLALAEAFESAQPIHPASVILLHRLITLPAASPLYNPELGEDVLDLTLHEVEAGLDGALR